VNSNLTKEMQPLAKNKYHQEKDVKKSPIIPQVNWLKSEYDDVEWMVVDDNPLSPKAPRKIRFNIILFDPLRPNEICRLTDPQYKDILDTVKRQVFGLRTGRYATVTAGKVHEDMATAILNWVIWMISNNIYSFAHLTQDDFDVYAEKAIYGPGYLLAYASRLIEHVEKLRVDKREIPNIKRSNTKPYLDARQLLIDAGIDPYRGRGDKLAGFEFLKISYAEGFYLKPDNIKRLNEGVPKLKKLSNLGYLKLLQPWDYQWRMRNDLSDNCLKFNPFQDTKPEKMAFSIGTRQTRTKTAPVQQTMELIEFSLKWVLDYAPLLLDLREQLDFILAKNFTKERRLREMDKVIAKIKFPQDFLDQGPLLASTKKTFKKGLPFGPAVIDFIPAACFIVICAFTARRHDEVLSIRSKGKKNKDCISKREDGFYLETYIEKTTQDWDQTPCNEVVVAAIEVLRRWNAPAKLLSKNVSLFYYKKLTSSKICPFRPNAAIKEFVNFLSLSPLPNGERWHFKPHQFRRFFAIMYFWRYEYGNLPALSHHFRHNDFDTTQIYLTESEPAAIFRHVGKEFTTAILTEAALGESNVSGPFGESFKKTVRRLFHYYRRSVKVVSSSLMKETVERYVEKTGRRLKGFKWGYCACGNSTQQLSTALCLQGRKVNNLIEPDISQSSPAICGNCPHHLNNEVFKEFWQKEIELHEKAATDPKNGLLLRKVSQEYVYILTRQFEYSFINSNPIELDYE
jgi:integrase